MSRCNECVVAAMSSCNEWVVVVVENGVYSLVPHNAAAAVVGKSSGNDSTEMVVVVVGKNNGNDLMEEFRWSSVGVEEEGESLGILLKLAVEVGKNNGNDWTEEIWWLSEEAEHGVLLETFLKLVEGVKPVNDTSWEEAATLCYLG